MKKQQGIGAFDLLTVLLLGGVILFYLIIAPYHERQVFDRMISSPPPVTVEETQLIEEFKVKPVPEIAPSGIYNGEGKVDGKRYTIKYYFSGDKTLTKEIFLMSFLNKRTLSGSAKYHFNGSVLVFTEVVGDRYLFPEAGEAVSVPNENIILLHDPTYPISLKSSVAIEQEKKDTDSADSTSIFDLPRDEAVERIVSSRAFFIGIVISVLFVVVNCLHMLFMGFWRPKI